MPSPVGHALAGLTVHVLAARHPSDLHDRRRAAVAVAAALAPDVDLLFRLVDGRNHHDYETHSIGLACAAAFVAFGAARAWGWARPVNLGVTAGLAWVSHVLLDYLNVDTTPPIGIMAFWPITGAFYKFPWPLFLDIGRTLTWATVRHDALAALWEAAVLTPLLLGVWRLREGGGK
ncbi:MAG: metal-dependent hydrolase [Vicinamibacteria bacterium]